MAKEAINQKQSIQRLYKGLNTDVNPVDQPDGTYRFVLNGINESREGTIAFLTTEEGNEVYKSLRFTNSITSVTYTVIITGSIYIDDNEHILFGVTEDNASACIIMLTGSNEISLLISDDDNSILNFKIGNQITGKYRLRNGCEKTIYWVDGINPVKTFTLSDNYYTDDYQAWLDGGQIGSAPSPVYDYLKFQLIKGVRTIPTFDNIEVFVGGSLKSGTYNFAIQYVDENGNETAWVAVSQLVPIYVSLRVGNYDSVKGSSNRSKSTDIENNIFGDKKANKKIVLTLGNLDISYSYYRIAVIEATSGVGIPIRTLLSSNQSTQDNIFTYDGNEGDFTETVTENILLSIPDVGLGKHLEQVEDRLLIANVKNIERNYCSNQILASKITAKYVISDVSAYDYKELGNPKNPKSYFEKISYMGGEVYAFGIVYIFPEGIESPAEHIPGRVAITADRVYYTLFDTNIEHLVQEEYGTIRKAIGAFVDYGGTVAGTVRVVAPEHALINQQTATITDTTNYNGTYTITNIDNDNFYITATWVSNDATGYVGQALWGNDENNIQKWEAEETASTPSQGEGDMAFWEMADNEYDDRHSCLSDAYWGIDGYNGSEVALLGEKIRHHKFPNRNTVPHFTSGADDSATTTIINVSIRFPAFTPVSIGTVIANYIMEYRIGAAWTSYNSGTPEEIIYEYNGQFLYTKQFNLPVIVEELRIVDDGSSGGSTSTLPEDSAILLINSVPVAVTGSIFLSTFTWYNPLPAASGNSGFCTMLGIKFDNIELPTNAIGYKIVRGKRDENNRTVLSKGYSGVTRTNDDFMTFHGLTESTDPVTYVNAGTPLLGGDLVINPHNKYFITPENLFENKDISPQYIKVEHRFEKESTIIQETGKIEGVDDNKGGWFDNDGFDWRGTVRLDKYIIDSTKPLESNHNVRDINYLTPMNRRLSYDISIDPSIPDIRTLYNVSYDNKICIGKLGSQYTVTANPENVDATTLYKKITYVSMNIVKDIHPNLDNIKYQQCKNNINIDTDDTNFGGDTFISHFYITNSIYQGIKTQTRIFDFFVKTLLTFIVAAIAVISLIALTPVATLLLTITISAIGVGMATDIFIIIYQTFTKDYQETTLSEIIMDDITDLNKSNDDTYFGVMEHAYGLFVESDINVALREPSTTSITGSLDVHSFVAAKEYMINKYLIWDTEKIKYIYSPIAKSEIYQLNLDFKRENRQKIWFSLPATYDCCSECLEEFPNRIFYSEKSFLEERADSYGKYLPLNYITVPGEHGEITNIFSLKNALYVHTKSNLWYIPQNTQERITGDVVSLIGTGGFFDSTPRPIIDDTIGSAGSTQKFSTIKTKYGLFFVDDTEGKIYILNFDNQKGTSIKELSTKDKGISKWLLYNIPFNLYNDVYQLAKYKMQNVNNPSNPSGIGFLAAYDFENNRILLTKRDYVIADAYRDTFSVDSLSSMTPTPCGDDSVTLLFNSYDNNFYRATCSGGWVSYTLLALDTWTTFFNNKSWTLSYSIDTDSWTSFHSYIPSAYIFDYKNLYSTFATGTNIWKHNIEDIYLKYYNVAKSFIIDYIAIKNPLETSISDNITMQTIAEKDGIEQRYVTFNKAIIYNDRQCTGELTLFVPETNIGATYMSSNITNVAGQITLKRFDKDWKINDFRDMRDDYTLPIFKNDWTSISSTYFIDKIVNTTSISNTKDWTQLEKFRDKYLGIRLIFDNLTDTKLTMKYTIETNKPTNS